MALFSFRISQSRFFEEKLVVKRSHRIKYFFFVYRNKIRIPRFTINDIMNDSDEWDGIEREFFFMHSINKVKIIEDKQMFTHGIDSFSQVLFRSCRVVHSMEIFEIAESGSHQVVIKCFSELFDGNSDIYHFWANMRIIQLSNSAIKSKKAFSVIVYSFNKINL